MTFSPDRLGRMRAALARHVEAGRAPGVVALVARRGEVHVETLGHQSSPLPLGEGQGEGAAHAPMARDTIFRVASMSKPVTAAAAMVLVEECRLRLDDPVDELLPELADRRVLRSLASPIDDTVPAERPIALRDLLTFTFGLGLVFAMPGTYPIQAAIEAAGIPPGPPSPDAAVPPDETMRRLGTLPLVHQPGAGWMYNTGSDVLGVLIARAAGQPFDAFLRERIFEPLGMKDTAFHVPPEKHDRFATSYSTDFATGALSVYDEPGGQWSQPPVFPSGAGGLVSTVDDFLAFGRMLLGGGQLDGRRVLSRASVELMTTDQLTPAQKAGAIWIPGFFDSQGWGFGVAVTTRRTGFPSVGAYGWNGGLGTSWAVDPAEELVGVVLTQAAFTSPTPPKVIEDFWTTAYQALED